MSKMQNEREKDLIIEARFHRQLIGPKGENIQKIREEFEAVQISFPDLGSKSDVVKLRGPHDDVDKCGKQLTKLYKDLLENNYQVIFTKIISENANVRRFFPLAQISQHQITIPSTLHLNKRCSG